jgi:hypothetical protein
LNVHWTKQIEDPEMIEAFMKLQYLLQRDVYYIRKNQKTKRILDQVVTRELEKAEVKKERVERVVGILERDDRLGDRVEEYGKKIPVLEEAIAKKRMMVLDIDIELAKLEEQKVEAVKHFYLEKSAALGGVGAVSKQRMGMIEDGRNKFVGGGFNITRYSN